MAFVALLLFLIDVREIRGGRASLRLEIEQYEGVGTKWRVQIVAKDHCAAGSEDTSVCHGGTLKQMLPLPHIYVDEFDDMVYTFGENLMVRGPVNGWPALTNLVVESVTCSKNRLAETTSTRHYLYRRQANTALLRSKRQLIMQLLKKRDEDGKNLGQEQIMELLKHLDQNDECSKPLSLRASLVGEDWTSSGWSAQSPGFVFVYRPAALSGSPVGIVTHGMDLVRGESQEPESATHVHMFAHRYPSDYDSAIGQMKWHSGLLFEWDHGKYTTVVELAFLNGVGGYKGRCNYYDDMWLDETDLYKAMPSAMKQPWTERLSEIRVYDVLAKNVDEFKRYLLAYSVPGSDWRFIEPYVPYSGKVAMEKRSRKYLMRYLLNYLSADGSYSMLHRNCQTFASAFYAFLTGDTNVSTISTFVQANYRLRRNRHMRQFLLL